MTSPHLPPAVQEALIRFYSLDASGRDLFCEVLLADRGTLAGKRLAEADAQLLHCFQAMMARKGRKPDDRNAARDLEIVRLRDEPLPEGGQRSFGEVCNQVKGRWPRMHNGKPLTVKAVEAAYKRAKRWIPI
jgi:hypothetical protein